MILQAAHFSMQSCTFLLGHWFLQHLVYTILLPDIAEIPMLVSNQMCSPVVADSLQSTLLWICCAGSGQGAPGAGGGSARYWRPNLAMAFTSQELQAWGQEICIAEPAGTCIRGHIRCPHGAWAAVPCRAPRVLSFSFSMSPSPAPLGRDSVLDTSTANRIADRGCGARVPAAVPNPQPTAQEAALELGTGMAAPHQR